MQVGSEGGREQIREGGREGGSEWVSEGEGEREREGRKKGRNWRRMREGETGGKRNGSGIWKRGGMLHSTVKWKPSTF